MSRRCLLSAGNTNCRIEKVATSITRSQLLVLLVTTCLDEIVIGIICNKDTVKMSSSSESENETPRKRKKGVVNSETYKKNIIKKARVHGLQHVNYAGKDVPAKMAAGDKW